MKNILRRTVFLLIAGVIGVYGYLALRGPQGLPALREKWREIRKMEEDNQNLERENQYRRERIQKLKENTSEQELEIRKKLKLVRPGETMFIIPDPSKHDSSATPAPPQSNQTAPSPDPAQ